LYHLRQGLHVIAASWDHRGGAESRVSVCGNSAHFNRMQCQQTSRKKHDKERMKSETYILERTRALFTGRFDEPCSGAAPLRPATSMAVALSPIYSGDDPPTSTMVGVGSWPTPTTRDT
jgi:hypothetical protein